MRILKRTTLGGILVAASVSAALLISLPPSPAQAQVIFGGPTLSVIPNSSNWAWDQTELAAFRAALDNNTNFGPGGVVPTDVTTVNLSSIDAASLSGINVFVAPWIADSDLSAAQVNAVTAFFLGGGSLLLLDDGSDRDAIAAALGIPTIGSSDGSVSNGIAPLYNGPFGVTSNVTQSGQTGQISAADVAATGGTVVSTNASGQVTGAVWAAGAYAPGAGAMVILGDIDMISTFGGATYTPPNNNGIFGLNSAAFLVNSAAVAAPEPGSLTLIFGVALPLAGAVVSRRRRK